MTGVLAAIAALALLLVFGVMSFINSDYIEDYDKWVEDHFMITLPFKVDKDMPALVDPGYVILKLDNRQMSSVRGLEFKESGYSGWHKCEEDGSIGYETPYSLGVHDRLIDVNVKQLKNSNDALKLYLDYERKCLILDWGVTTDTGLEIDPMHIRKILGLPNPNNKGLASKYKWN
jgi:hypothetical protein